MTRNKQLATNNVYPGSTTVQFRTGRVKNCKYCKQYKYNKMQPLTALHEEQNIVNFASNLYKSFDVSLWLFVRLG
jgi:hypothetical protein